MAQSMEVPVSAIKRFGAHGPEYEVLGSAASGEKGEQVRIRLVRSGEVVDYPLTDMLADPLVP